MTQLETDLLELMKAKKNLKFDKQILNWRIKAAKRELHNEFVSHNQKFLRICDICFVICILFNFGALFLTNIMVSEVRYDNAYEAANEMIELGLTNKTPSQVVNEDLVVFRELNPTTAKIHKLETVPTSQGYRVMFSFIKQCLFWAILFFAYLYHRMHIRFYPEKYMLAFTILFYLVALGRDFWWDAGLWVAKLLFSGG